MLVNEARPQKGTQDPACSILKIKGAEIQQATSELLMDVIGPLCPALSVGGGLGASQQASPDWSPSVAPGYFNTRRVSIYGGSDSHHIERARD